jgi:hypothetical protein
MSFPLHQVSTELMMLSTPGGAAYLPILPSNQAQENSLIFFYAFGMVKARFVKRVPKGFL